MSKVEVDQVTQQSGTTLTVGGGACKTAVVDATTVTLGRCGGTVSLASGATQSGFGRTGTVDWDTTPKTGTVTAATGKGYFVNTTSGAITVNLPAGAAGSIVGISDYASTAASNNILVEANGAELINADAGTYTISTAGLAVTLVYVDGTRGWKSVTGSDADATGATPAYVAATGGTPCGGLTVGDYKYHKFTAPGTLIVTCGGNAAGSNTVQALVVAGGGGSSCNASGGAGAGGLRNASCVSVTATPYAVTVGGGGATAGSGCAPAITPGVDSTFSTITSAGGGRAGIATSLPVCAQAGVAGGSGGGGVGNNRSSAAGAGNTPAAPVPLGGPQGQPGGNTCAASPNQYGGGGGGGGHATAGECHTGPAGSPGGLLSKGGDGGNGTDTTPSFPAPTGGGTFAGGGGGGASNDGGGTQPGGAGGPGGGGAGGTGGAAGAAGTTNTGGGGGGGPTAGGGGGGGGSGIVIIKYKFQ